MATLRGFAFWNPHIHALDLIADPEAGKPDARFNDGKVDGGGRFWAGTQAPGTTSSLFRLDPDLAVHVMDTGIGIANGIGWAPDRRTMYFGDSRRRTIYAYDFDPSTGGIENRRSWLTLRDDEPGVPDGLAVDSDGFVWSARWDGAKVCRYDPAGKLEREIPMPVQRPTSCAFGGDDLKTLYITSAWSRQSQQCNRPGPLEGDVFCLQVDVKGLPEPVFTA